LTPNNKQKLPGRKAAIFQLAKQIKVGTKQKENYGGKSLAENQGEIVLFRTLRW